jgi:hypothetical protein
VLWLVDIDEFVLEGFGNMCMTQVDSKITIFQRCLVGTLSPGDKYHAVCFFGGQSPLSVGDA